MASLTRHRVRAVVGSLVDGVLTGGAEAALDLPARSRQRATVYAALLGLAAADALVPELPMLRRAVRGLPPDPVPPQERASALYSGLVCGVWGLVATIADGPAARALRGRGIRRPHLLIGVLVGTATTVSTLPIRWDQAAAAAAADEASEALDRELAELLAQSGT
jgi:hypothetical protein